MSEKSAIFDISWVTIADSDCSTGSFVALLLLEVFKLPFLLPMKISCQNTGWMSSFFFLFQYSSLQLPLYVYLRCVTCFHNKNHYGTQSYFTLSSFFGKCDDNHLNNNRWLLSSDVFNF